MFFGFFRGSVYLGLGIPAIEGKLDSSGNVTTLKFVKMRGPQYRPQYIVVIGSTKKALLILGVSLLMLDASWGRFPRVAKIVDMSLTCHGNFHLQHFWCIRCIFTCVEVSEHVVGSNFWAA